MKLIRNISLSAIFCLCHFFILSAALAAEWILESQIAKDTWGLEEQSPKYEWGLEEQTPKHDKSDSIILHYDGKAWDCIYNGHGIWLNNFSLPFIHGFELNICLTYQTILIRVLTNYSILLHILIKVGRLKYFG